MMISRGSARKLILIVMVLVISGCAHHYTESTYDDPYGFFSGVWHGVIFPLTLMVNFVSWLLSLIGVNFLHDIEIIGRPNTGFAYYIGFVLGVISTGGSGARG
jgi:hypothetical protein